MYLNVLRFNRLSPCPNLERLVTDAWIDRIRNGKLLGDDALDVAEELNLRTFLGYIYYYLMIKHLVAESSTLTHYNSSVTSTPALLGDLHRLRILAGYRSLTMSWERLILV